MPISNEDLAKLQPCGKCGGVILRDEAQIWGKTALIWWAFVFVAWLGVPGGTEYTVLFVALALGGLFIREHVAILRCGACSDVVRKDE